MYKTYSEAARELLGINYYNKRVKELLFKYLAENELKESDIIKKPEYFCIQCGKYLGTTKKKFCSNSCAATYNNTRRKHTEETKQKISESLKGKHKNIYPKTCVRNKNNKVLYPIICSICGKEFYSRKRTTKYCSQKCSNSSEETKSKLREAQKRLIIEGKHAGWQKRNITSYAETFWMQVLDNNGIQYTREDHSTKHYFLDFLIIKNGKKIDLEIDGKQHKYIDRKAHDEARDKYLTKQGYIVYRVKWNSLLSEVGRTIMKDKIDKFLEFYNSL